ncbi:hypothetical protein Angca_003937 [Angiostrongylus cantonensis]|nr:hypothetical protein Angca_003937 [Angiostrongylus cantonensis]
MRNEASSSSTDLTRTLSRKRLRKAKEYRKAKKKPILEEVGTSCDISLENGAVDRTYERYSEGSNDASDSGDLIDDESSRRIDFDIEAFPMESGDREGVVNMLTQIFLRADIDLEGFANSIIAQSPLGLVFGPAEDQSEEESENVVYGVVTAVSLINLGNAPKFMKDILDFLEMKSRKFALKEFRDALEVAKSKRTGIFINERMLNFPYQIVKPSFSSIKYFSFSLYLK